MTSRRLPGRYPPAGESDIADAIRKRRGERGLTPLDGTLLHFPAFAGGWNSLLGAVRTGGSLPPDVRELMILRVAAHNHAAYEWIHHEHVATDAGVTLRQLLAVRDTTVRPAAADGILTSLQAAAVVFADESTKGIRVSDATFAALQRALGDSDAGKAGGEERVQDLLAEAAAVVATYNMVSRFLIGLDIAGSSETPVPTPAEGKEHTIPNPTTGGSIHAITLTVSAGAPYLALCNSLLTSILLWSRVSPALLNAGYNLILHDQRGHGLSSVPAPPTCTINDLADDLARVLDALNVQKVRAVIGVSQGGATALAFGLRHAARAESIIACDTQASTPEANIKAWDDRLELARKDGMGSLATATVGRWFPPGSACHPDGGPDAGFVLRMVEDTKIEGFETGMRALQKYDLVSEGLMEGKTKTLFVVGEKDGVLPGAMTKMKDEWTAKGGDVRVAIVAGSGHLPMLDNPGYWVKVVKAFLAQ